MPNARLAEFLLRRTTTADRASAIVGDLLEEFPSAPAFWFAITRVALSYTWRWLLAIPTAMFSILLGFKPYAKFVVEPYIRLNLNLKPMHYGAQPMPASMRVGTYIVLIGICLWTIASLALVRYGIRSSLTRLSCLVATLCTAGACAIQLPHAVIAVPLLLTVCLATILAYAPWRRLFGCIFAAGTAFSIGFMGLGWMMSFGLSHFGSYQTPLDFAALGGYVACIVGEAICLSRTRRWLHVA